MNDSELTEIWNENTSKIIQLYNQSLNIGPTFQTKNVFNSMEEIITDIANAELDNFPEYYTYSHELIEALTYYQPTIKNDNREELVDITNKIMDYSKIIHNSCIQAGHTEHEPNHNQ